MKRFVLTIISSCVMLFVFAQEEIGLDSIPKLQGEVDNRQLSAGKSFFLDDSFPPLELNLFDNTLFNQPLLPNYTRNLDFLKNLNTSRIAVNSYTYSGFVFSPFISSARIFNQETYRLNNRLSFGGNSFGAQSVFDMPNLNPSIQDMNTKGASLFMQYKVSKKFKVEGQVSITNRSNPWEP